MHNLGAELGTARIVWIDMQRAVVTTDGSEGLAESQPGVLSIDVLSSIVFASIFSTMAITSLMVCSTFLDIQWLQDQAINIHFCF